MTDGQVWIVFNRHNLPLGYSEHRDAAEAYARDLRFQQQGPVFIRRGPIPAVFRNLDKPPATP